MSSIHRSPFPHCRSRSYPDCSIASLAQCNHLQKGKVTPVTKCVSIRMLKLVEAKAETPLRPTPAGTPDGAAEAVKISWLDPSTRSAKLWARPTALPLWSPPATLPGRPSPRRRTAPPASLRRSIRAEAAKTAGSPSLQSPHQGPAPATTPPAGATPKTIAPVKGRSFASSPEYTHRTNRLLQARRQDSQDININC